MIPASGCAQRGNNNVPDNIIMCISSVAVRRLDGRLKVEPLTHYITYSLINVMLQQPEIIMFQKHRSTHLLSLKLKYSLRFMPTEDAPGRRKMMYLVIRSANKRSVSVKRTYVLQLGWVNSSF
jgi:hypothetical protein